MATEQKVFKRQWPDATVIVHKLDKQELENYPDEKPIVSIELRDVCWYTAADLIELGEWLRKLGAKITVEYKEDGTRIYKPKQFPL